MRPQTACLEEGENKEKKHFKIVLDPFLPIEL